MGSIQKLRNVCREANVYALSHLATLDKITPEISQGELGRRTDMRHSTVCRIVDTLELQGLVTKITTPGQGLQKCSISVTDDGQRLLDAVRAMFAAAAQSSVLGP